jgi:hypothetical protein
MTECLVKHQLSPVVASPSEAGTPFDAVPDLVEMIGVPASGVVAPGVRVGKRGFTGVYLFFERTPDAAAANVAAALHAYMTRRAIGTGYRIEYPPTRDAAKRLEGVHGNVIAIWDYPRRYYVARSERELAECFARDA